jgi:transcriptional regulator with XRE-family HTH domain
MKTIQTYIKNKGILQSSIVEKTGLSQVAVSRVANVDDPMGKNNFKVIKALAETFDVTAGDIVNQLIDMEDNAMKFEENHTFSIFTTIWNKDDSIFSDDNMEFENFTEALKAFESNVADRLNKDKMTFDLIVTEEDSDEPVTLLSVETLDKKVENWYIDNLDQVPLNLKSDIEEFVKKIK